VILLWKELNNTPHIILKWNILYQVYKQILLYKYITGHHTDVCVDGKIFSGLFSHSYQHVTNSLINM